VLARQGKAPLATLRQLHESQAAAHSGLALVHLGLALKLMGDETRARSAIEAGIRQAARGPEHAWWGDYGSNLRDWAMIYVLLDRHQLKPTGARTCSPGRWRGGERALLQHAGATRAVPPRAQFRTDTAREWNGRTAVGGQAQAIGGKGTQFQALSAAKWPPGWIRNPQGAPVRRTQLRRQPGAGCRPRGVMPSICSATGSPPTASRSASARCASAKRAIVRLQVKSAGRYANGLVVDHIPAGLEIENANIVQGEQSVVTVDGIDPRQAMQNSNIRHVEFRDDRFVVAARLAGRCSSSTACASSPRVAFVVPPTYAEDMYQPQIHGLAGGDEVLLISDGSAAKKTRRQRKAMSAGAAGAGGAAGAAAARRPALPAAAAPRGVKAPTGAGRRRARRHAAARVSGPGAHLAPPGAARRGVAALHRSAGRLTRTAASGGIPASIPGPCCAPACNGCERPRRLRRLDADHAGGAPARTDAAHAGRQAAPDRARAADRTALLEARNPRDLPQPGADGRRPRRRRSSQPRLPRQTGTAPERAEAALLDRAAAGAVAGAAGPLPATRPAARDKVLERMESRWGAATIADARQEPVIAQTVREPLLAPLFAERLRRLQPHAASIESTLDAGMQQTVEQLLATRLAVLPPRVSMAALVVDNGRWKFAPTPARPISATRRASRTSTWCRRRARPVRH
jgi:hypothetical protein